MGSRHYQKVILRSRMIVLGFARGLSGFAWAPPCVAATCNTEVVPSILCVQLLRGSLRFAGVSTLVARTTSGPRPLEACLCGAASEKTLLGAREQPAAPKGGLGGRLAFSPDFPWAKSGAPVSWGR
jgi:hypothetical protein